MAKLGFLREDVDYQFLLKQDLVRGCQADS